MKTILLETLSEKQAFFQLYNTTGSNSEKRNFSEDDLFHAVKNSWYTVSAYQFEQLIGFG